MVEKERETELSAQSLMRGSTSQIARSRPEPKSAAQSTEPPRCPKIRVSSALRKELNEPLLRKSGFKPAHVVGGPWARRKRCWERLTLLISVRDMVMLYSWFLLVLTTRVSSEGLKHMQRMSCLSD